MATYHIKKDTHNQYYWILKSDNNGNTICKSSEAYTSKQNVQQSIAWTRSNAKGAGLQDHT